MTLESWRRFARVVIVPLLVLDGGAAHATTVLEVGLEEMLGACALIFDGQVLERTVRSDDGGRIHTDVTFEVVEVLKGRLAKRTVQLSFLGGTLNGRTLQVSGMQMPRVGERGIYFVESITRPQANPLYGWDQGHLLVVSDPQGYERVTTHRGAPVTDFTENTPEERRQRRLNRGVARGLNIDSGARVDAAMRLDEFKRRLTVRLANSR